MKKYILRTLLGFLVIISGVVTGYIYFQDIQNMSPFLIGYAVTAVPIGIVMLFKAGRSEHHIPHFKEVEGEKTDLPQSLLSRQNEMIHSYHKTSVTRDKLKILKRINT